MEAGEVPASEEAAGGAAVAAQQPDVGEGVGLGDAE